MRGKEVGECRKVAPVWGRCAKNLAPLIAIPTIRLGFLHAASPAPPTVPSSSLLGRGRKSIGQRKGFILMGDGTSPSGRGRAAKNTSRPPGLRYCCTGVRFYHCTVSMSRVSQVIWCASGVYTRRFVVSPINNTVWTTPAAQSEPNSEFQSKWAHPSSLIRD